MSLLLRDTEVMQGHKDAVPCAGNDAGLGLVAEVEAAGRSAEGGAQGYFRFRSVATFGCFPSARRLPSPARLSAPLPGARAAGPSPCGPPCVCACARAHFCFPQPGTRPAIPRPSGARGLTVMTPGSPV